MDPLIIPKLEAAAAIIMAPPNQVKSEDRHQAEAVFMAFRNNKGLEALKLCQHILENSKVDLVLFESINFIKRTVITSWSLMDDQLRLGLRQYLLEYVTKHLTAPFFLREKILQVIGIMIKRNMLLDGGRELQQILEQVKSMFQTEDSLQRILAATLLHTLVQEYTDVVKSEDSGLTFDEHFRAKKLFENAQLRPVFLMVLNLMAECGQAPDNLPGNANLLQKLFDIMEDILTWGYISPIMPKKLISLCEMVAKSRQAPPLRLCAQWNPVMMDPKVLMTFFFLYWKVRESPDVRSRALTCLIQLATLSGPVVKHESRVTYFKAYLDQFMQLLGNETSVEEVVGFSMIVRKVVLFNSGSELAEHCPETFRTFIEKIFNLTTKCIEGAALEASDSAMLMEGFENCLESWVTLIQVSDLLPGEKFLSPYLTQIFNKYVQVHLSPPEGMRSEESDDEINEHEEWDRDRYREQLIIIGSFAREVLPHALPILAKLLEDKIRTFAVMLQTLYQSNSVQLLTQASEHKSKELVALERIFEDLHWLLLITCHTMASESEGETSLIPSEVNELCQRKVTEGSVDLLKSLELIAKPDKDIAEVFPENPEKADFILRILASIMRLSELETTAINCGMQMCLSPELSSSLMWFFRVFLDSYLFPLTAFYTNLCESAEMALTSESEGGKFVLNYVLRKVIYNIQHFAAEEGVIFDTVEVFLSILKRKHRIASVYHSEVFAELFSLKNANLHVNAKRGLIMGLVKIASSIENDTERQSSYLDQIFGSIAERYLVLMHSPDIKQTYQHETVKLALLNIIEEVKGCVGGAFRHSSTKLFHHFKGMFMELPELLNLYKNYSDIVEAILDLFCDTIINLDYASTQADSTIMTGIYECCMALIRVWFQNNATKISIESKNYEDCPQDILLIFKLLHCLLSKSFFEDERDTPGVDSAEVVVFGLSNLMPLITMDLIRFPDFCSEYYRTISIFANTKSYKVTQLNPDLFSQMLSSVQLGLNTFTSDIQSLCFDFLSSVGSTVYEDSNPNSPVYTQLQTFLPLLFNMVFSRQIDSENRNECYGTIYILACTYKEDFHNLMQSLIANETDLLQAQKVRNEYNSFITNLELANNRAAKSKFIDRFDKFVTNLNFLGRS